MKKLDRKQKWTLIITIVVLGVMVVLNNLEQEKLKDKIEFKTENLTYNLDKNVTLKSSVGENVSTDYYTLDNGFKFSVSRYGIEYKDSVLSDIKEDFKDLGKFGEYIKNDLKWITVQFEDIPLSNGGCFLLETDSSLYYIEANSTKEDIIDIIDRVTINNEKVQDVTNTIEELNTKVSISSRDELYEVKDSKKDRESIVLTDNLNGLSTDAKLLVHFNKKIDPVEAVKVYSDKKCEDDSLVFTWNKAYETNDGMDIIVEGDANLLLCQDRLDYDILQSNWGNANKLYLKILNEDDITQSFVVPITFIRELQAPITFTSNGKDVEWLEVDEADYYRVYMSELDREGKLGREQGYINEKPRLLATVSKGTNKFSISDVNKDNRFYVTAVKEVEYQEESIEKESENIESISDTDTEEKNTKDIESLFSEEVSLNEISLKPIQEIINKNSLDFSNIIEHPEIKQIKYTKTSVDQRTELELKRVEKNGVYEYPLSVIPHYVMTGSYPSDMGDVIWTDEEIEARSALMDQSNVNQNNIINILLSNTKNQVEGLNSESYDNKYMSMINFDNEYEKFISNALLENSETIELNGKNNLNDIDYLNKVIKDVYNKNILLDDIEEMIYDGDTNSLKIKYTSNKDRDDLDKFIEFSKELYKVNDIDGILRWIKELQIGGNVKGLIESFEDKGYTKDDINTYLLDIILKSNGIPSKVVAGTKKDETYVWNLFKYKNTWYQYDINDDLTSKKEYKTELDIKGLYDTNVDDRVKNSWYTDRNLEAASEKDLINIICNRYAEQDKIIIKLNKGFTFEYSEEFGEKLVKQLQNLGYSVSENFSYSVVGNYVMIMK